jgi:hypothetical protein
VYGPDISGGFISSGCNVSRRRPEIDKDARRQRQIHQALQQQHPHLSPTSRYSLDYRNQDDDPVLLAADDDCSVRLSDENAILVSGAEIHVDVFDPVTFKRKKFGVAKILAVLGHALVGNKGLIALDEDPFEFMPFDPFGVAPAPLEIRRLVDLIVIRTGEAEILCQSILHRAAVICHVGSENGADDVSLAAFGHRFPSMMFSVSGSYIAESHRNCQLRVISIGRHRSSGLSLIC